MSKDNTREIAEQQARHNETGEGFDWYHTEDPARRAFDEEKKNCVALRREMWEAAMFTVSLDPRLSDTEVTDFIDERLDELFDAAPMQFSADEVAREREAAELLDGLKRTSSMGTRGCLRLRAAVTSSLSL